MSTHCLLLAFLMLAGCSKPPLADIRYDFNGDVVGVTTLAQFKEKHADKLSVGALNAFERYRGAVVLNCEHNEMTGEPTFGGHPVRAQYTFMNDVLESIDLTLAERNGVRGASGVLQDAIVEKLGTWRNEREGTKFWESQRSNAWYTTFKNSLHLTDGNAMLAYNKSWEEYCEHTANGLKGAQPLAKEDM